MGTKRYAVRPRLITWHSDLKNPQNEHNRHIDIIHEKKIIVTGSCLLGI